MKKQAENSSQNESIMHSGDDSLSRVLLIVAIVLYTFSLVLLANLVMADEQKETHGALIKVNNKLDGDAFARTNATVKSVHGNILGIRISSSDFVALNKVKGACAGQLDQKNEGQSAVKIESIKLKFSGANVVVGILDNSGTLHPKDLAQLKKIETDSNIGFISYRSDDPTSTIIIRNLKGGESNLVQSLAYMQEYARTVNKPLIIEMILGGKEMANPLFVQVCQQMAETGVQFVGASSIISGPIGTKAAVQLAFSTFNSKTGQITDRSDFWAISEVKEQQIMLLGSDNKTCNIFFQTESGFDKVYMSNSSDDRVMVTILTANGEVNYFHVINKETALIPRELLNGTPVLEDGLAGIYPYHTKKALFNGAVAQNQFVALGRASKSIQLHAESGMALHVGSPSPRTLAMSLSNLDKSLEIKIRNERGETVYRNSPDADTKSIQTKINLAENSDDMYFLDLTSPEFYQSIALQMN